MDKRRVILVTDGDSIAQSAVERAAYNIGGRCISASAGNPTPLSGREIIDLIKQSPYDPVVVMVDDHGAKGVGPGEKVMSEILNDKSIDVLGVVAVSSNGSDCNGLGVTCSIDNEGRVIENAVDKHGNDTGKKTICGDTLSILKTRKGLIVVGIGDPGKMEGKDEILTGAKITTKALEEIIKRSGR